MNATPRDTKVKEPAEVFEPVSEWSAQEAITCFASSGSVGVVDLGASQTVIGSKQVPELLHELPPNIRSQVRKTSDLVQPCISFWEPSNVDQSDRAHLARAQDLVPHSNCPRPDTIFAVKRIPSYHSSRHRCRS